MNLLEHLTKIANALDEKGLYQEADEIDDLIKKSDALFDRLAPNVPWPGQQTQQPQQRPQSNPRLQQMFQSLTPQQKIQFQQMRKQRPMEKPEHLIEMIKNQPQSATIPPITTGGGAPPSMTNLGQPPTHTP